MRVCVCESEILTAGGGTLLPSSHYEADGTPEKAEQGTEETTMLRRMKRNVISSRSDDAASQECHDVPEFSSDNKIRSLKY